MSDWTINDARDVYNTPYWGQGYFDISTQGEVVVCPNVEQPQNAIALSSLADELIEKGVSLPVLVRFPEILHHRVDSCAHISTKPFQITATKVTTCWSTQSR